MRKNGSIICVHLRVSAALFFLLTGCGHPNLANIQLRKENQSLRDQITTLDRQREADHATIRGLESKDGTVPVLPTQRVDSLFTVHGLKLGRLTGGADLDVTKRGDEGVKVYIVPTDDDGDPIKAAGTFVVDAFDLARSGDNRVGHWEFDPQQTRKSWFGSGLMYTYVLTCPWQTSPPEHAELTLKITFVDGLTQRQFEAQKVVKVNLAPSEQSPTTAPITPVARP
jgi:hypothetical protein